VADYMPRAWRASASQQADKTAHLWHHLLRILPLCQVADSSGQTSSPYLRSYPLLTELPLPTAHTILLYGHDELLLMTRGRILDGAGFQAAMTMDVREIPRLVRELSTDLIVLCHSLSGTECVLAGMVAKNHRAALRTLLIVADDYIGERDYEMSEVADEIFKLSLEPEKLVAKVRSMIDGRPQSRIRTFPQPELVRRSSLARTS
jgi:hypothetical protein